jgi:hypothetical protein
VTPSAAVGHQIPVESLGPLLARLGRSQTHFRVLTQLFGVERGTAQLIDLPSGAVEELDYDLIVVQTGREARALPDWPVAEGVRVHRIGDCVSPRRMANAVFEAQRLGNAL